MKQVPWLVLISFVLLLIIQPTDQVLYVCDPSATCGCSANSTSVTRIVGGEIAATNTWGWAVSLSIDQSSCGGSILSSQWIMTAAHCVEKKNASQIKVYAGSNMYLSGQLRNVSRIIAHPSYSNGTHQNDIALLQLSSALNMNDINVRIACIPAVNSSVLSAGEWPRADLNVSNIERYIDYFY